MHDLGPSQTPVRCMSDTPAHPNALVFPTANLGDWGLTATTTASRTRCSTQRPLGRRGPPRTTPIFLSSGLAQRQRYMIHNEAKYQQTQSISTQFCTRLAFQNRGSTSRSTGSANPLCDSDPPTSGIETKTLAGPNGSVSAGHRTRHLGSDGGADRSSRSIETGRQVLSLRLKSRSQIVL